MTDAPKPDLTVIAHDLHDLILRVALLVQELETLDEAMTPAQRARLKRKIKATAQMARGQCNRMMAAAT